MSAVPSNMISGNNQGFAQRSEMLLVAGMLAVITVVLIPLPTFILDMLLALNLGMALLLLLVTINTKQPLELSSFPSILLLLTLYRLAINVATTRLILSEGDAGKIVSTFGGIIVGNSLVVGIVIFLILITIQFVVITKGATRISEVNARFVLDALPGKQMAIDAEMGAGVIDKDEARRRREHLASEAEFYGAMDGASKYVRGDAIAGLIITVVNILGGVIIGISQGLDFSAAIELYTKLTIGDGLMSQIPALLIATTSGILVTKAATEKSLGHEIGAQMLTSGKPLWIGALIMVVIGLTPGLPKIPFFVLAAISLFAARSFTVSKAKNEQHEQGQTEDSDPSSAADDSTTDTTFGDFVQADRVLLELGLGISSLVDKNRHGGIENRIVNLRKELSKNHGFWVPQVRLRSNPELKQDHYRISINGRKVGEGSLQIDEFLAINPGTATLEIEGTETIEPAFGLQAKWIAASNRQRAEIGGYTVVDAMTVLVTHMSELFCAHAQELLGVEDLQKMLKEVETRSPSVVAELRPEVIRLGTLRRVLCNLLAEKVSIASLENILESVAHHGHSVKQPAALTELVRADIGSNICQRFLDDNGELSVIVLEPKLESFLRDCLQQEKLALSPVPLQNLIRLLQQEWEKFALREKHVAVLTEPQMRRPLREAVFRALPDLGVLSFTEVTNDFKISAAGYLRLEQVVESSVTDPSLAPSNTIPELGSAASGSAFNDQSRKAS